MGLNKTHRVKHKFRAGLLTAVLIPCLFTASAHETPDEGDTHPGSSCNDEGPFGLPGLTGAPDVIGEWSDVLDWPVAAIHMTLLHTGKVLFWRNARPAYLFDPLTEEITPTSIPGPESPEYNTEFNGYGFMFCSAHVTLADGRVLAAGGTVVDPVGLPDTYLFDPDSGQWETTDFMASPRYYPSMTTLLDGRVLVHGGAVDSNGLAIYPEVYDPATETWNTLSNAPYSDANYPRLHVVDDGTVLDTGPKPKTRFLDVDAEKWTTGPRSVFDPYGDLPSNDRSAFAGTMYRRNEIIKIGGYDSSDPTTNKLNRVEVLNWNDADPQWQEIFGMDFARRRANSVILPDGTLFVVGGAVSGQSEHECAIHAPELWNPDTQVFTTLASHQRPRVYHSTALLLPDGRILSASGENLEGREENAEIFSPPYLFKGPRPVINSAPAEISFAENFVIDSADAATVDSVVLIRPGSVTHNLDMNQRYVPLNFTVNGNNIEAVAPPNSDAPPGYYMLFVLNDGVPSIAPMILLGFDPAADADGDGMPDNFEDAQGFDKNDPFDAGEDFDADTLTNLEEYQSGSKPKNADWDHDNLDDAQEAALGTDPNNADTDGDTMPDGWETQYGLNPLDPSDAEIDSDNDGLTNVLEYEAGRDPTFAEVTNDSDNDGMPDDWETQYGFDPLNPADATNDPDWDWINNLTEFEDGTNPLLPDTDGDGLTDFSEKTGGTNPTLADTDSDGLDDKLEKDNGLDPLSYNDADGDGMSDDYEIFFNLLPDDGSDAAADRDNDGLVNLSEFLYRTDLDNPDTDGDGLIDSAEVLVDFEVATPTDPLDPDTDDDLMPDGFEVPNNLDAHNDDSADDPDGDGLHNYGEFRLSGDPRNAASPGHSHGIVESFESGMPAVWNMPANVTSWAVDDTTAVDGAFSLRSGVIANNETTEISFPLFAHDSVIRLRYYISSASGNTLSVYIDNVLQVEVDGNVAWTSTADLPLLDGFHEIRFVYSKGSGGQAGCDCARIDLVEVEEYPLDLDGDGMPGAWEDQYGLDRNDPADKYGDLDGDRFHNLNEYQHGTDPTKRDTDGDWLSDKYEMTVSGTNPLLKDTDSDQLTDYQEVAGGLDPLIPNWPMLKAAAENPLTEEKRVLGKILFWDEQLSSDDSVACGTCHMPHVGGGDPRIGDPHPGPDGLPGTEDDILGSPGMVHLDTNGLPVNDPVFGLNPQITRRNSPSIYLSMFDDELFLDGRAGAVFIDPVDGITELLPNNSALETQAVEPILSMVEMAKEGRTWSEVIAKLESVTPLAVASLLPPDLSAAVAANDNYPDLFSAAFGDPTITPARIAMVIASYERTLVPDQTPWDLYMNGDADAMTDMQIQGWELLRDETTCTNCHTPPLFTDNLYWNIGVRPAADDAGRMEVTASGFDYGRFKTATLRNVGLRTSLMHNGQVFDLKDAIDFYMANHHDNRHTQFAEFQTGIPISGDQITDDYSGAHVHMTTAEGAPLQMPVLEFLNFGLTDPRVENETFPFDRPRLSSESADGDGDGMLDVWEVSHGLNINDPADAALDNDGDGLSNLEEFNNSADPNDVDTDNDWIRDSFEVNFLGTNPASNDTDNDTIPDFWEAINWVNPLDPASALANPDNDAYTNLEEYQNGTNPRNFDP